MRLPKGLAMRRQLSPSRRMRGRRIHVLGMPTWPMTICGTSVATGWLANVAKNHGSVLSSARRPLRRQHVHRAPAASVAVLAGTDIRVRLMEVNIFEVKLLGMLMLHRPLLLKLRVINQETPVDVVEMGMNADVPGVTMNEGGNGNEGSTVREEYVPTEGVTGVKGLTSRGYRATGKGTVDGDLGQEKKEKRMKEGPSDAGERMDARRKERVWRKVARKRMSGSNRGCEGPTGCTYLTSHAGREST